MLNLGQRVTLKSITDLYEDGTLVDKELDFQGGRLNDKHTIILLPEEQKYLGQSGTVVAYSHNVTFIEIDGESDYMATDDLRPLAIQMDDGYILRLIPIYLVADIKEEPRTKYVVDKHEVYVKELEQEVLRLRRVLAYYKAQHKLNK